MRPILKVERNSIDDYFAQPQPDVAGAAPQPHPDGAGEAQPQPDEPVAAPQPPAPLPQPAPAAPAAVVSQQGVKVYGTNFGTILQTCT